jgi:hypothetical protein
MAERKFRVVPVKTVDVETDAGEVPSVLSSGGEMGALMRSIDWSKTAVGPTDGWPQSLCTALSILLDTGFPMYIAWGPDFTQFYNDGYRPILGSTKHPAAMGTLARAKRLRRFGTSSGQCSRA